MTRTQVRTLLDEVLDFLVASPTPQQIVDFHNSGTVQVHVRDLLERKRNGTITPDELAEMGEIRDVNHFVTLLKARAHIALRQRNS